MWPVTATFYRDCLLTPPVPSSSFTSVKNIIDVTPGEKTRELVETFGMKRIKATVSGASTAGSTFDVSEHPDSSFSAHLKVPNARGVQGHRHQA